MSPPGTQRSVISPLNEISSDESLVRVIGYGAVDAVRVERQIQSIIRRQLEHACRVDRIIGGYVVASFLDEDSPSPETTRQTFPVEPLVVWYNATHMKES